MTEKNEAGLKGEYFVLDEGGTRITGLDIVRAFDILPITNDKLYAHDLAYHLGKRYPSLWSWGTRIDGKVDRERQLGISILVMPALEAAGIIKKRGHFNHAENSWKVELGDKTLEDYKEKELA